MVPVHCSFDAVLLVGLPWYEGVSRLCPVSIRIRVPLTKARLPKIEILVLFSVYQPAQQNPQVHCRLNYHHERGKINIYAWCDGLLRCIIHLRNQAAGFLSDSQLSIPNTPILLYRVDRWYCNFCMSGWVKYSVNCKLHSFPTASQHFAHADIEKPCTIPFTSLKLPSRVQKEAMVPLKLPNRSLLATSQSSLCFVLLS